MFFKINILRLRLLKISYPRLFQEALIWMSPQMLSLPPAVGFHWFVKPLTALTLSLGSITVR